jgi:superfamily II DNA or RNA helicase
MITLRIGSHLELSGLPLQLERQFIQENTFQNPKRETLERLGKWAGGEPEAIELWARRDDRFCLPRGYFPVLIAELKRAGLQFRIEDRTICPPLSDRLEAKGLLYPFQERALADLLRWPTGVLEAPTGSGKTNILLSAAARLGTPALICVHTTELMNQTSDRIRSWLGVEPGVVAGSKAILRPITVAMIQTLARRNLKSEGIADYFGSILVDEAHHSPAVTWANILQQMPARYKYGFTATAWRKDGLQFLMWRLIGSKSAKIEKPEAEAAGKIILPEIETVATDYFYPLSDSSEWTAMLSDLIADSSRNSLIESEVRSRLNGSSALILTDRIEHANILADQLEDLEPVLLTGELSRSEREQSMIRVRKGARLTIATTHLLGEGVDVPGWDLLFLVSPIAGGPRTLQAVGRVSRPAPGKRTATVVDFIDCRIPMLANAARGRQRLYAR